MGHSVIEETRKFVKEYLNSNDASHDWLHIERVTKNSLAIAKKEALCQNVDLELVEMAALLHDIGDYKYSKDFEAPRKLIAPFLQSINVCNERIEKVLLIVENMSFRKELASKNDKASFVERFIVQDGDRLDAIGAIGIARCFTFGGARNTPIYDPDCKPMHNMTFEQYNEQTEKSKGTSLNHFYEKLFKLKELMKTDAGKQLAQQRHDFMVAFVDQLQSEIN